MRFTELNLFLARQVSACLLVGAWAGLSARAGGVILEDQSLLVAFDRDSGALTRLEDKSTHWVIEQRPELGGVSVARPIT